MAAGDSAQKKHQGIRRGRHQRIRRSWPSILIGVVIAFGLGYLVPVVVFASIPAVFGTVAPGADWSDFPEVPTLAPLVLGVVMALYVGRGLVAPSRREVAWGKGASGERRTGRALSGLPRSGFTVLHDCRMPGSVGNIDHLVVTSSGVFTIDAKRYAGKLEIRGRGREIWVRGRNRSRLLDQAIHQASETRRVLEAAGFGEVPVTPVICFVDTEMPLLASGRVGGVMLCTPRTIRRRLALRGSGALDEATIGSIARVLEEGLSPLQDL